MAKADTSSTRLPRGTGPVTKAFFAALDGVPDAQRAIVAKAAQSAIRDELKRRQEKVRGDRTRTAATATRPGAKAPARAVKTGRAAAARSALSVKSVPPSKGRPRRTTNTPTARMAQPTRRRRSTSAPE